MESRIKSGRREGFTVLYNSMITDQRLSLKTKGLFAVMMSRPENWEFSVSGLAVFSGAGKDTIRTCLKELESTGYLTRSQAHDEGGKFTGNVYVLSDIASPLSENTDDGENRHREKPLSVFPTQINKDLKEIKTKEPPIVPREIFQIIQRYAGDDKVLLDAILDFLDNRKKLDKPKPVKTARSMNGILSQLDKLSGGNREIKLAMLNKATVCNWLTVYALRPDELASLSAGSGVNFNEEGEDGI